MVASGEGTSPTAVVGGDECEDEEPSAGRDFPTMPSSSTPLPAPAPKNTKACRNSCLMPGPKPTAWASAFVRH